MARKIFSLPINPKLTEDQFVQYYYWLEKNKDWIADVYFTSRIAPFNNDAMGDIVIYEQDKIALVETAVNIQKYLGIPVSATFNNIQVAPTQKNLDTFIKNFKPLYDAGIKIATIPHTHWMMTGQIKAAFPDLFVKNTILREVRRANEIVDLAKAGFDYINLDRELMRDRDRLLRLKEAKVWIKENLGKDIQYSLLANEGCLGNCPVMEEHFHYNNVRQENDPQYFNSAISRVSCPKWEVEDPSAYLKGADLPPWKEDWDEFIDELGIDVFKMHGRESLDRLGQSMRMVERYINGDEILADDFDKFLERTQMAGKPIEVWREKIKTCKFDCWECQYCDKIEEKRNDWQHLEITKHVVQSVSDSGIVTTENNISGLTSPRIQTLLNKLASKIGSYLEVGSYLGSTAAAVLENNLLNAYFIDKWQEQIQPARDDLPKTEANSEEKFLENIQPYVGNSRINVINSDMLEVDLGQIQNNIQLFFYDGPHDKQSTSDAVKYYYPILSEEAILVFDDANWSDVVMGAKEAIAELGVNVVYEKLILNDLEDKSMWWNGVLIMVIKK